MNRWLGLLAILTILVGGCAGGATTTSEEKNQPARSRQGDEGGAGAGGY